MQNYNFPVVLCGCKTLSLALRAECRLRVFESMVLKRVFGLKRDDMIGGWSKLRNEQLQNMYFSTSIITRRMMKSKGMRFARFVTRMGREEW
jgi:hypothetical protein